MVLLSDYQDPEIKRTTYAEYNCHVYFNPTGCKCLSTLTKLKPLIEYGFEVLYEPIDVVSIDG